MSEPYVEETVPGQALDPATAVAGLPSRTDSNSAAPVLAGLAVAIAGGILWALVVRWTNHEFGIGAWLIGAAVGAAVSFTARGIHPRELQVTAAICALGGILAGKYLEVAFVGHIAVFSATTWRVFSDTNGPIWSGIDLLWIALALSSAFRLAKRTW